METKWLISFTYQKFLGGFDGEFRYSDNYKGEFEVYSNNEQLPSQEEIKDLIKTHLRSKTIIITILNINKVG
jgi:hypothetical protein